MNIPLIKYHEEIEDISITAQKERDIESKLFSIEYEWRQREFKFTSLKNRGELLLRGQETSEILAAIDDSNLILAALASNRYNIFFKNQIQKSITDLAISAEILTKWMQVQNLWIYLGTLKLIFSFVQVLEISHVNVPIVMCSKNLFLILNESYPTIPHLSL